MGARVFAVVDALDAMTDHRPYQQALHWVRGHGERAWTREQFDPDIVDAVGICEPDLFRIHTRQLAALDRMGWPGASLVSWRGLPSRLARR